MKGKKDGTLSVPFKDKMKSSYYLNKKTEEHIIEIYIKRLKEGSRIRKSGIVDEAVELLYNTEFKRGV
jgi:hypothetical protein